MFTMKKIVVLGLILVFSMIYLMGCGATVVGTKNQPSYTLKRNLSAPIYWEVKVDGTPQHVFGAALKATGDLSLNVIQQTSDQLTGLIKGYFADGTRFVIKLDYDSPGITNLQITAGNTGDKTLVLQIFRGIERYL